MSGHVMTPLFWLKGISQRAADDYITQGLIRQPDCSFYLYHIELKRTQSGIIYIFNIGLSDARWQQRTVANIQVNFLWEGRLQYSDQR